MALPGFPANQVAVSPSNSALCSLGITAHFPKTLTLPNGLTSSNLRSPAVQAAFLAAMVSQLSAPGTIVLNATLAQEDALYTSSVSHVAWVGSYLALPAATLASRTAAAAASARTSSAPSRVFGIYGTNCAFAVNLTFVAAQPSAVDLRVAQLQAAVASNVLWMNGGFGAAGTELRPSFSLGGITTTAIAG